MPNSPLVPIGAVIGFSHTKDLITKEKSRNMKTVFRQNAWKTWITFLFTMFLQIIMWGQDSTGSSSSTTRSTTTTTTTRTEWYTAPWVWVVGGAVLIILLVAILSGSRSSRSRTTVTKTNDYGTGTTKVRTTEVDED